MATRRHGDADLLGLARDGSAPALASLVHRHRDAVQRAALRAAGAARVTLVVLARAGSHALGPAPRRPPVRPV
ncbi:MAG: hypothetical protein ACO3RG_05060 [Nitriliruptoraceae bacterium]